MARHVGYVTLSLATLFVIAGCRATPESSTDAPSATDAAAVPVSVLPAAVVEGTGGAPRLYPCEDGRRLAWTGTAWAFVADGVSPELGGIEPPPAPDELLESCRLLDIIEANGLRQS